MKRQAKSYAMVDHQLLHGGYLRRLTHKALAFYLFLAVVGDREGVSFYSERSIADILRMTRLDLLGVKDELLREGLIDYQKPYWRVLTLTYSRKSGARQMHPAMVPLVRQVLEKNNGVAHA